MILWKGLKAEEFPNDKFGFLKSYQKKTSFYFYMKDRSNPKTVSRDLKHTGMKEVN